MLSLTTTIQKSEFEAFVSTFMFDVHEPMRKAIINQSGQFFAGAQFNSHHMTMRVIKIAEDFLQLEIYALSGWDSELSEVVAYISSKNKKCPACGQLTGGCHA